MPHVSELVRGCMPRYPGMRFGMEVEFERAIHLMGGRQDLRGWHTTPDNSLRHGGLEFVSRPYSYRQSVAAIRALYEYIEAARTPPEVNVRTGTHIHVNVEHLTPDQLGTLLALYLVVEPLLFDKVGAERAEGPYAQPLGAILPDWGRRNYADLTNTREWCKYTALNLRPLGVLGTIEFRHAPAWATAEPMIDWLRTVNRLVRTSLSYASPQQVVAAAQADLGAMLKRVLYGYKVADFARYDALTTTSDSVGAALRLASRALPSPIHAPPFEGGWELRERPLGVGDWRRYRGAPKGGKSALSRLRVNPTTFNVTREE